LEGWAADIATDLVADRASDTLAGKTNLVGGAGEAAGGAVIAVGLEIDAFAVAAGPSDIAGDVAGPTVALVAVEQEALAVALVAATLAPAGAAPTSRALAALAVGVAIPPHFLAACHGIAPAVDRQACAKNTSEEGPEGAAARHQQRLLQSVEG
jgi:hypothetical protein